MWRSVGYMAAEALPFPGRFVRNPGAIYGSGDIFMAGKAELTRRLFNNRRIISRMGGMAFSAPSPDNRRMGPYIFTGCAYILMAGKAEGAIGIRLSEILAGPGIVQPVTADAVAVGKGSVQAESSPFIGLPFMAAEAEHLLRSDKQGDTG